MINSRSLREEKTMKNFGLFLIGGLAAVILLKTIGPMIGLAISLVLLYFIFKQFLKTASTAGKIGLGVIGFIVLMSVIQHVPALIGVAAAYVLYLVYQSWNGRKERAIKESYDPFTNFEKQWNEIVK
jgi:lia operon protein LiaI